MSKIESTWDDGEMICPYCGWGYQPGGEEISEDRYEIECEECGKKFWGTHSITIHHEGTPDCELNGDKHTWEKSSKYKYPFCAVCGKVKRGE